MKQSTRQSIDDFRDKGLDPGGFVRAVLENNLWQAYQLADDHNRLDIFGVLSYVVNELPLGAWGSANKVRAWIENHGKAQYPIERGSPDG